MNIQALEYFIAIVEEGSFTAAARRCRVAQPSLSQQIRRMEDQLGYRLFERKNKSITLTGAGKQLLPRARRIVSEYRDLEQYFDAGLDEKSGKLAIGAIPTMAPYVLPDLIEPFTKKFPKATLSITEDLTENLISRLQRRELDLAVMSAPLPPGLVEWETIATEKFHVAITKDRQSKGSTITIDQLEKHPFLLLNNLHCMGKQTSEFCAATNLSKQIVCEATQISTIIELVARGIGSSLIPAMSRPATKHPNVSCLNLRGTTLTRDITIAWPAQTQPGELAKGAAAILRRNLK